MYIPPAFRIDEAASLAFAAVRGFGLVIACAEGLRCACASRLRSCKWNNRPAPEVTDGPVSLLSGPRPPA